MIFGAAQRGVALESSIPVLLGDTMNKTKRVAQLKHRKKRPKIEEKKRAKAQQGG